MAKIPIRIEIGGQNRVLAWSFGCTILIVFAKESLKVSFKALGGHQNCYSELRILIVLRRVTPKFWFASKIGDQSRVLAWSFCCTILIAFANGGLTLPFTASCGHKKMPFWAMDSHSLPSWVAKILIGSEIGAPNQCMILTAFAKGGLKLSFKAVGGHTNCYS